MTENVSLNLEFDYTNRKYKVSARYPASTIPSKTWTQQAVNSEGLISSEDIATMVAGFYSDILPTEAKIPYIIMDSDACILKQGYISGDSSYLGRVYGQQELSFGINSQGNYGYNRSGENTKLYATNPFSEFPISSGFTDVAYPNINLYLEDYLGTCELPLSKHSNNYLSTPIQVTDGGSCLYASVSAISNNRITWANSTLLGSTSSINFTDAKVVSISGSLSGNEYRVLSYDNTNKYLYLDKSGSLTNNIIKVCPRTTITGYTAWNDTSLPRAVFHVSPSIIDGIGDVTGSLTLVGDSTVNLGSSVVIDTTTVTLPSDPYLRDPSRGDLLLFTSNSGPAATGLILDVSKSSGTTTMKYYPRNDPDALHPFATLKRTTKFNLEYFPKFSTNYSIHSFGDSSYPFYGESIVMTPGAELEVTAGDYDSAFGNVSATSNFHMGPLYLTNGEVLTGNNIIISGQLFNNNPTSTVALNSWRRWTSCDPNIGSTHTGIYSKFGSLVGTYSQAFTTPDMLTLEVSASIGNVVVKKIVNLPVAPPV